MRAASAPIGGVDPSLMKGIRLFPSIAAGNIPPIASISVGAMSMCSVTAVTRCPRPLSADARGVADDQWDFIALAKETQLAQLPMIPQLLTVICLQLYPSNRLYSKLFQLDSLQ